LPRDRNRFLASCWVSLDAPRAAHRTGKLADVEAGLRLHQSEPEVLADNARDIPGTGRRADRDPCWASERGGANGESQAAGPRSRDHVGVESRSRPEVEIKSLQPQQRPEADVYLRDAGNVASPHGRGFETCSSMHGCHSRIARRQVVSLRRRSADLMGTQVRRGWQEIGGSIPRLTARKIRFHSHQQR
jgi:hypothetical protein